MTTNPVNFLRAQPRLVIAAFTGVLVWLLLPRDWRASTRLLAAWDCDRALLDDGIRDGRRVQIPRRFAFGPPGKTRGNSSSSG